MLDYSSLISIPIAKIRTENSSMEVLRQSAVFSCAAVAVVIVVYACKILNWAWFTPRRLERRLHQLGFKGNPYRVFFGDFKEMKMRIEEARSKPMPGVSHQILPRVVPSLVKAVNDHGKNCIMWFGPRPTVIIWDPDHIREILSKIYIFLKPVPPVPSRRLAQGLVSLEKDEWAKHRRLINPAFHVEKLKLMIPSFYLSCADMLSKWDEIVLSGGGLSELDVWPHLQAMTSDVISRTAFGSSYEEGRKIFELQREQGKLVMEANRSVYIPGMRFLPTEFNRKLNEIVKEIESSVMGIINRRIKSIEAGEGSGDDLLGLLLESNFMEIKQHGNHFGMSLKQVIEECKLFYFAGQETTSSLLVWTMILLSNHPEWQVRAREEVLQVFGQERPEYHELNQLKVVTMIFHEIMRLYSPAILLARMTVQETMLGDLTLPAGVQLWLPIIMLHHDPKIWGDDAKEFNPERFNEGVSNATQGRMVYFPFGGGPRFCIGQNFAMAEAKMAMSMILQRYSFELSPSYAHAPAVTLILQPQHGAHLLMRKIV